METIITIELGIFCLIGIYVCQKLSTLLNLIPLLHDLEAKRNKEHVDNFMDRIEQLCENSDELKQNVSSIKDVSDVYSECKLPSYWERKETDKLLQGDGIEMSEEDEKF